MTKRRDHTKVPCADAVAASLDAPRADGIPNQCDSRRLRYAVDLVEKLAGAERGYTGSSVRSLQGEGVVGASCRRHPARLPSLVGGGIVPRVDHPMTA